MNRAEYWILTHHPAVGSLLPHYNPPTHFDAFFGYERWRAWQVRDFQSIVAATNFNYDGPFSKVHRCRKLTNESNRLLNAFDLIDGRSRWKALRHLLVALFFLRLITSSCSYSTCTGGVQAGTVLAYGVRSLEAYASATIDPNLAPSLTFGQALDTFSIAVDVMLQTYGSGAGALVVDPLYTISSSQHYPEVLETSITGDVNNSDDPQITCAGLPMGASSGNDLICSGEASIPITLGGEVQLVLKESNVPGFALPASSTLATD